MAPPTNTTAATALVISSLPYAVTIDKATPGGLNPSLWWTYTATAADVVLGAWAFTDLAGPSAKPWIKAWFGTAASLTAIPADLGLSTNVPYSIPVTAETVYFLQVGNAGIDDVVTPTLAFSVVAGPADAVPSGSLFVNDETFGFPVVMLAATDGSVLNVYPFASGESADIQPTGEVLAESWDANQDPLGLALYDASLTLVSLNPLPGSMTAVAHIHMSWVSGWWVSGQGTATTSPVVKVALDGSYGVTETLTHASTTRPVGIAPSPDDTILYYALTATAAVPVQRWSVTSHSALSDLVAGVANYQVMQDPIGLADGTILIGYKRAPAVDSYVVHVSAAGAVLHTYALGAVGLNRLARDPSGTSFWVWIYPVPSPSDGLNRYVQIAISSGTFLQDFTVTQFERGNYKAAATATPTARFGPSFSCPFWVGTGEIPAGPPGGGPGPGPGPDDDEPPEVAPSYHLDARYIRRLRRAPHVTNENLRVFYRKFELDLERGQGLATGQGSDPMVLLRISRDGGQTWGEEQRLAAGALGAYTQRVIARRLGQARDTVFEVVVSDPIAWSLVGAWLDLEPGTS